MVWAPAVGGRQPRVQISFDAARLLAERGKRFAGLAVISARLTWGAEINAAACPQQVDAAGAKGLALPEAELAPVPTQTALGNGRVGCTGGRAR